MKVAVKCFFMAFGYCIKIITNDRGFEFNDNCLLQEKYQFPFYFCHAHCSWERGTNECINRRLRRSLPKGSDLSFVSEKMFNIKVELNNSRPYKVLNNKTPLETFMAEMMKCSN